MVIDAFIYIYCSYWENFLLPVFSIYLEILWDIHACVRRTGFFFLSLQWESSGEHLLTWVRARGKLQGGEGGRGLPTWPYHHHTSAACRALTAALGTGGGSCFPEPSRLISTCLNAGMIGRVSIILHSIKYEILVHLREVASPVFLNFFISQSSI